MAQLRVRKKEQAPRPGLTLVPMALVLAAGIATTVFTSTGDERPVELAREAEPVVATAWQRATTVYLGLRDFEIDGRAWVVADTGLIGYFAPQEMVSEGTVDGWKLYANRVRGARAFGPTARAFDRLYLELSPGRYLPLAWREVPPGS